MVVKDYMSAKVGGIGKSAIIPYVAVIIMFLSSAFIFYIGKKTPVLIISAAAIQMMFYYGFSKRTLRIFCGFFIVLCVVCIGAGFYIRLTKGIKLCVVAGLLGSLLYMFNKTKNVTEISGTRDSLVVTDYIQDSRWITMLQYVLRGDPYKSIAIDFNISESAVKKVMTKVYKRFNVASREELIKLCASSDVVFPSEM